MKILKRVLIGLVVLFVLMAAVLFLWLGYLDSKKGDLPIVDQDKGNVVEQRVPGELMFLLAGVDSTGAETGTRTDTLMLMRFNFNDGDIDVLSIPRDTRVYVKGKLDKINHAHSYGGMQLTLSSLRAFLGLDIDYYLEMDFEAVKKLVDVIGGVEYSVPDGIDFEFEGETIQAGKQKLNGAQSLAFLRHRSSYRTGDLGRVQAQQDFMKTLFRQVLSVRNVFALPGLLDVVANDMKTNIPFVSNAGLLFGVGKLKTDDVNMQIVPGSGQYVGGVSYYIPKKDATVSLVREMFRPYLLD